MATYGLYLESGPRRRKTMVHVLDLLGCVATGPTTDAALAASPDAIRAYLRFLQRHGEPVAADEPITTEVIEHVTEGLWIGNGSPAIVFGPDLEPISAEELEALLRRFRWMRETLAVWATTQTEAQLDAPPAEGGAPAGRCFSTSSAPPAAISAPRSGAPAASARSRAPPSAAS